MDLVLFLIWIPQMAHLSYLMQCQQNKENPWPLWRQSGDIWKFPSEIISKNLFLSVRVSCEMLFSERALIIWWISWESQGKTEVGEGNKQNMLTQCSLPGWRKWNNLSIVLLWTEMDCTWQCNRIWAAIRGKLTILAQISITLVKLN